MNLSLTNFGNQHEALVVADRLKRFFNLLVLLGFHSLAFDHRHLEQGKITMFSKEIYNSKDLRTYFSIPLILTFEVVIWCGNE